MNLDKFVSARAHTKGPISAGLTRGMCPTSKEGEALVYKKMASDSTHAGETYTNDDSDQLESSNGSSSFEEWGGSKRTITIKLWVYLQAPQLC